jgi:hypothetical protein
MSHNVVRGGSGSAGCAGCWQACRLPYVDGTAFINHQKKKKIGVWHTAEFLSWRGNAVPRESSTSVCQLLKATPQNTLRRESQHMAAAGMFCFMQLEASEPQNQLLLVLGVVPLIVRIDMNIVGGLIALLPCVTYMPLPTMWLHDLCKPPKEISSSRETLLFSSHSNSIKPSMYG